MAELRLNFYLMEKLLKNFPPLFFGCLFTEIFTAMLMQSEYKMCTLEDVVFKNSLSVITQSHFDVKKYIVICNSTYAKRHMGERDPVFTIWHRLNHHFSRHIMDN